MNDICIDNRNLPIHWAFTDPINHRYDVQVPYTIDRWKPQSALEYGDPRLFMPDLPAGCFWGSVKVNGQWMWQIVRPRLIDRLRSAAFHTLGLLDADGQAVMRGHANA